MPAERNEGYTIHEACREGDLAAVQRLLTSDPDLVDLDDEHEWRPIFHAALCRHTEVVRFLISAGADLAAHDGYVLHYGGEVPNNKDVVSLLVKYGALDAHIRPSNDLFRQFMIAVFLADTTRTSALLQRHSHLAETKDGRGDFPIHHATRNGDTQIVELLIAHGADVNAITDRGHTVLYCAGGHGHCDTVDVLLHAGSDVHAKFTDKGITLLNWLAQFPNDARFERISNQLRVFVESNDRQGG